MKSQKVLEPQKSNALRQNNGLDIDSTKLPCTVFAMLPCLSWILLLLVVVPQGKASSIPCNDSNFCATQLRPGSECLDGFCTNPFYKEGCIKSYIPDWHKIRVCNSADPHDAVEQGLCVDSPFNYMEIRALGQDWESSFFSTWILQIILSELLDVPTSVEAGDPNLSVNFYDRTSRMDYGPFDAYYAELGVGVDKIDCRKVYTESKEQTYQPCAQVATEGWVDPTGKLPSVDTPRSLGALGVNRWFIPHFTATRDPTLVSYIGLSGEENRRKLAETFKRPTTWKTYCDEVSIDNCASQNGVATRAPLDETEEESMFVEGLYTGYFRATDDNDCDANPTTCTGHIADYPCTWTTYTRQQTYHLGISLKSDGDSPNGGYSYSQLTQIWAAANATKSDVIMQWWSPEALSERFLGSDAEFTPVLLPTPTQKCEEARIVVRDLCGNDAAALVGSPEGACDWSPQTLYKLVVSTLQAASSNPNVPVALWSPAYDAIANLEITNLQYGDIFQRWFALGGRDEWRFDPRDATCQWVVDNLDLVQSFIPVSFPRTIKKKNATTSPLFISALGLSIVSIIMVAIAAVLTYVKRTTKALFYAQVEFIFLLLTGLILVAASSLALVLEPTDISCAVSSWLENIGNVLVLLPLVQRMSAIGKLATTGKLMKHVRLRLKKLAVLVTFALCAIVTFLIAWTLLDPPLVEDTFDLTSKVSAEGETIVYTSTWCSSESELWVLFGLSWQGLFLLPALVLSVVAGRLQDVNDTKVLGIVLFSRTLFLLARVGGIVMIDEEHGSVLMGYTSIILSMDTLVSVVVYVYPKFLKSEENADNEILPDLFLNTTIMVANIDGFTAWSSVREPIQVFKFLETLYERIDEIEERHRVFKVESMGGLYVAACGLPESRPDHAVVMARFASDCLRKAMVLSKQLEVRFGPDTGELQLRIGLHSGPVTGGYMSGKHSRFQLFGDTMTTVNLMCQLGESDRIHVSEVTANLLIEGGKTKWLYKREAMIQSEKGDLQTFWLVKYRPRGSTENEIASDEGTSAADSKDVVDSGIENEQSRWIEWNTEVLKALLQKVVAGGQQLRRGSSGNMQANLEESTAHMPLDEVQEIIELPDFDKETAKRLRNTDNVVQLPKEIVDSLRDFVTEIAGLYRNNPFHNFAHASYVVMAVSKYLNRIVAASEIDVGFDGERHRSSTHSAIHDHTYGIASDPLTQFACLLSALVHDIDHPGVPNPQLIKENERLATVYKNRSVAEQRSFDLSWDLFMEPKYDLLRATLCQSESELRRFRHLVINSVMATDLGDKELKTLRNNRWSMAFDESAEESGDSRKAINRKATIVIEHLIQAADVAHTCQHWNIYRKWNERLFEECYEAYRQGRSDKNPADYWYEGEIGFFDFYIIPLSKKLRDCGVFGPTSDENLNYARSNREMWVKEGQTIVEGMLQRVQGSKSVIN